MTNLISIIEAPQIQIHDKIVNEHQHFDHTKILPKKDH